MIKAKYTVVLKTLLDDAPARERITAALSTYPLYVPEKKYDIIPNREELNRRLLNHYKYREIGFETVGRFLDELQITMEEIMPRYNELLKTCEIMAELPSPFDNVDVVETFEQEREDHATSNGGSTSKTTGTDNTSTTTETTTSANDTTTTENEVESNSKHIKSSTPQDSISIPANGIDSVKYADEANWGKDHSNSNGTSTSTSGSTANGTQTANGSTSAENESTSEMENTSTGTTRHTFTKKGNQGVNTYAHDMNEFRTSIIDVVDQIIHDPRINELFMLVY